MHQFLGYRQINAAPASTVVTIGNFDGVHHGHRKIIGTAVAKAQAMGGLAAVYTFRPHPRAILKPGQPLELLTTYEEKAALIEGLGVSWYVEEPFSRDFSMMSAERFFSDVILGVLRASAVVVGYDFGFGKDRQGSLEILRRLCQEAGVDLEMIPQQSLSGCTVSSSKIRELLHQGNLKLAHELLGSRFSYSGVVVRGDARGRTIGFPTANVRFEPKLILPLGVYAVEFEVGSERWSAVANLGVRPTVSSLGGVSLEVHVLDRHVDLYEARVRVHFVEKIREERKFSGMEELKTQIAQDAQRAREIFK